MNELRPVRWQGDTLALLDQRRLPGEETWLTLRDAPAVAQAIRDMVVRGAPAIGVSAAYGVALSALRHAQLPDREAFLVALQHDIDILAASRPTAVNLFWALARMRDFAGAAPDTTAIVAEAIRIHDEDIAACRAMGAHGAALLPPGSRVYTHCNAGALATGGYGTALGVIRSARKEGRLADVHAGETRPWLQGARLTAWELSRDDIPVTLVTEGAAAQLFRSGRIDWVIVGADRIAANGDVANKIGTYGLAVLARHHGVRFMVAAPTSTIDLSLPDGSAIPIEERDATEVTHLQGVRIAPEGVGALNPSFDVTPAELIDAIVTERGVIRRPGAESLRLHMA